MVRRLLGRLRDFLQAETLAVLRREVLPELLAARAEISALRAELAEREARENALVKQMEAALLTIALARTD